MTIRRGSRSLVTGFMVLLVGCSQGLPFLDQSTDERANWEKPIEPFHIVGNVSYVGTAGLSVFLVTTSGGSILIDGALRDTVPQISANIARLGFRVTDIKYLLNSHAHFDHAGGLAELKKLSGGQVVVSEGDAPGLRIGNKDVPPIAVDRVIADGETVQLGGTTLTAHITPGHTRGCTTWTMTTSEGGRGYRVMFYCSTVVTQALVGNDRYPEIAKDYERTFARLREMSADVFLAPHPEQFAMESKRNRMKAGSPNPFIDPGELQRVVASSEQEFRAALNQQSGR